MTLLDARHPTARFVLPQRERAKTPPQRVGIFTSLDGTLLDPQTFDAGSNAAAVEHLQRRGIGLVPVTVMTLPEVAPIAARLGIRAAMIIENGGAIAWHSPSGWNVEPVGQTTELFLDAIREIEDRSAAHLIVYSAIGEREAAQLSGRSGAMLEASRCRSFSEPFVIERGTFEGIRRAAATIGFEVRRGRRFLYLCRSGDMAAAFARVRSQLRFDRTIGIGGSAADVEFLRMCDAMAVLPSREAVLDDDLWRRVPGAHVVAIAGSDRWRIAVDDCLLALRYAVPFTWKDHFAQ